MSKFVQSQRMDNLTLEHNYQRCSGDMVLTVTDTRTNELLFEACESFPGGSDYDDQYECFLTFDNTLVVARSHKLELVNPIEPSKRVHFKTSHGFRFKLLESPAQGLPSEIDAELKKLGYYVEINKMTYIGTYESDSYPAYAELFKFATDPLTSEEK